MKQAIFVPCDSSERNQKFLKQFTNSLRKFHPNIELRVFDNPNPNDKDFWYRAKPVIASQLFDEGYEVVIGADCDQIILGSLSDVLDDSEDYDVGVVLNDPTYPIQVWDMTHPRIFNNGLVVMKSKEFVDHWLRLCLSPHFYNYQYREQDLLCLLTSDYFNYKVKILDGMKVYGEWAKPLWAQCYLKDDKVMLKWREQEVQLCVWHSGGGNTPDKGNYRIRFSEEVIKYIDNLIT